jgi:TetR/AcrR family transcriptional regulator, transcriptional repressor for nem operon
MAAGVKQMNSETASRILDVAERLTQTRGFNAFSYADIATKLKITKASVHYHFATKAELGEALVDRYAERFAESLAQIAATDSNAEEKLKAYADLYGEVLRGHRMCLCGVLAAEYPTLPKPMRDEVHRFFEDNEAWLRRVLEQGRAEGTLGFSGSPDAIAAMIVSSLEGAVLVGQSFGDLERFRLGVDRLLALVALPGP